MTTAQPLPLSKIEQVKDLLALCSIQSVSGTISVVLAGYLTVTTSITDRAVIALLFVFVLHFLLFALNDVADYELDALSGREEKPLVKGSFSVDKTRRNIIIGLGVVGFSMPILFEAVQWGLLVACSLLGVIYNYKSSTTILGPPILGVWSFAAVLFGASLAGAVTELTLIFASLIGLITFHITYAADLKDLSGDKKTLPEAIGAVKVEDKEMSSDGGRKVRVNPESKVFGGALSVAEMLLILTAIQEGRLLGVIALLPFMLHVYYAKFHFSDELTIDSSFRQEIIRLTYTAIVGVLLLLATEVSISIPLVLAAATVIWGIIWQTLLYGSPNKYP